MALFIISSAQKSASRGGGEGTMGQLLTFHAKERGESGAIGLNGACTPHVQCRQLSHFRLLCSINNNNTIISPTVCVRIPHPAITEIITPRIRVGKSSAPRVNTTGIEPPTPGFVLGGLGRRLVRQQNSSQCKAPNHGSRCCQQTLEVTTDRSLAVHKCVTFCEMLGSADPVEPCWHSPITKSFTSCNTDCK